MMKRTTLTVIAAIAAFSAILLSGQDAGAQEMRDSLVYHQAAALDSALLGRSVFNIISTSKYGEGEVKVHQSQSIANALQSHINGNRNRKLSGYRKQRKPARMLFQIRATNRLKQSQNLWRYLCLSSKNLLEWSLNNALKRRTILFWIRWSRLFFGQTWKVCPMMI